MKKVKIGSFLKRRKHAITVEDRSEYKRLTIRSKHQGICLRDKVSGVDIGTKNQFQVTSGNFVLSKIDAMNGAFGIVSEDLDKAIITGNFWEFEVDNRLVLIEWFNVFVSLPSFYDICRIASTGTTHRKYLDERKFLNFELNLPNLSEQKEQLLIINNLIEKNTLITSKLQSAATYVSSLRQSLLQDAIQGKLVPQDQADEPASVLLEKIKAEKEKLIKEGKIKKENPLSEIKPEEIPFELPSSWTWIRLGQISKKITDGEHLSPPKSDSGVMLLTAKDVREDGVSVESPQYVSESTAIKSRERCDPNFGDILICSRGTIGRNTIVNIKDTFCLMGSVILVKPSDLISSIYLNYVLKSDLLQQNMMGMSSATAVSALYLKDVAKAVVPLPPVNEQVRIALKLDRIMGQIDNLVSTIEESKKTTESLLTTSLNNIFQIQT